MTRRWILLSAAVCILGIPGMAQARWVTTWNVGENFANQGWQANTNLLMRQTGQGIRLQPRQAEATIQRAVEADHPIDAIRLTYLTPTDATIKVLWSTPGTGNDTYASPMQLPAASSPQVRAKSLSQYGAWDSHPTSLGFLLPQNTDLTLQTIELLGWNPLEKTWEALQGFWRFDDFRPYSVNFLWGPRLSVTPIQTEQMFWIQPPEAPSANIVFYIVLAGGAAYVWLRRKPRHIFWLLFLGLWVLYDVRMGTEIMSYAYDDYRSYHSKPVGERTFRERLFFNDMAEVVQQVVADRDKYIFLSEHRWPYLGLIRYYTYPSIPTHYFDGNANRYDTWIVYNRPDIRLNTEGQLTVKGQTLSPPGRILHEFTPGSFIFRAQL